MGEFRTDNGSGGKSSRLAVGGLLVPSCYRSVEVSLSETPKPPIALGDLVGTLHSSQYVGACVCVNG